MATLLLRLAAPLQAWGSDSKFETRKTNREPTKSGVIGLLAAALGLKRNQVEELEELSKLRFGVRVEREGKLLIDYHTARDLKKDKPYVTYRHYLQDAVFLVGLESEDNALLQTLEKSIRYPAYPLFLGRRSCPPTLPLCLGIKEINLIDALENEPDLCENLNHSGRRRIVIDANPEDYGYGIQQDLPLSFDFKHRQYGYRSVKEYVVDIKSQERTDTEHDPFHEL